MQPEKRDKSCTHQFIYLCVRFFCTGFILPTLVWFGMILRRPSSFMHTGGK
ncbi:hypothetical protein IMCC21224_112608 [Puniceibacterium sp. IMCC21224]|nr:hypothetical protein IMCC21224_112608 [Puniceibacterium sp. IMCC21224]